MIFAYTTFTVAYTTFLSNAYSSFCRLKQDGNLDRHYGTDTEKVYK